VASVANIIEQNIYSPSITKVDANNDVANQQLANRTLYLKTTVDALQKFVNTYKTENTQEYNALSEKIKDIVKTLTELQNTSSAMDEKAILKNLTEMNKILKELQEQMKQHTHLYAGSKRPGGDANSVDVLEDNISEFNIVGSTELMPSKLRKSTRVTVENDTVKAGTFEGDLNGVAKSARTLHHMPKITLSGDVVGSAEFIGDKDVIIRTNLKDQNVSAGEYGTVGNYQLSSSGSFTVPDITVNSLGIITKIRNRTITLPKNMGINGITSSLPTEKKLYILGASEQAEKASVYTQNKVYIDNHTLYSNDKEVINESDFQQLKNKTYEGYELGDACERGVDETIGGSQDDSRLITSNALFRHKHKYAVSDTIDGKTLYVKLVDDVTNKGYLVTNSNPNGSLTRNPYIYTQGKGLFAEDLNATQNMFIPGGKIWIDSVELPIADDSWSGSADTSQDLSNLAKKTRDVPLAADYVGSAGNVKVYAGTILAYKKNGYVPADNRNAELCDNIVLANSDGTTSMISVMSTGRYDLETDIHDGKNCYVGQNGTISFAPIKRRGLINKKIGYVEGTYLVFQPSDYALLNK
jgi:hypothetical protein